MARRRRGKSCSEILIYRICGTLITELILIVIVKQMPDEGWVVKLDLVFWLESIAVVAFGVSWLTKGEIPFKMKQDI